MPKRTDLHKILVIGSGPIVIGQAAEFDYAGTQACLALREEGYEVVLCNSNPATIMTDQLIADKIYMEPLTLPYLSHIIRVERPDALIPGLGGQTGLNLAIALAESGVLDECGTELLGTSRESIRMAEDREDFKALCERLGEPVLPSRVVRSLAEGNEAARSIGFPLVLRPAFTLGGSGGGFVEHAEDFTEMLRNALAVSPVHEVLIEKSVRGYKEIEYEVMRDANDTAITICNMENLDPVGIHTGDSIVVCPSQTLTNKEYQMLRDSALRIIRALEVEGGCNVQFALDPDSFQYYLIEVNPRVSRSSALASKASGYPIARVSAKICVGMHLDEIHLANTPASFEPALDYIVTKMPRFPFDKFAEASRQLGTQMKATGEVMSIGRTWEESLLKAVRSLEIGLDHLRMPAFLTADDIALEAVILSGTDERIYAITECFRRAGSNPEAVLAKIHDETGIDCFFLRKIAGIVQMETTLAAHPLETDMLLAAKRLGFSDAEIARLWNMDEADLFHLRQQEGICPVFKMIDSCAAEFDSYIPYFYSTYEQENESIKSRRKKIIVLGSGPIRIGQGVEFDYSTVHAVHTIREAGFEAIIINNNPETVSTDYTTADKLYFEPLTVENVMDIVTFEDPSGVITTLGGQTAINLAASLDACGVPLIGTDSEGIARAEDRKLFEQLLIDLGIPQPDGRAVTSVEEGLLAGDTIGFPVLVRPSFVLGGRAMQVVSDREGLLRYLENAVALDQEKPVLVDRYICGKELEVDAICDGKEVLIPGIMELIERTGIHSGDSMSVYPAYSVPESALATIRDYTRRLGLSIGIIGLMNIQFIVDERNQVWIIEVNPRSSRTVPFLSKATGLPLADIATRVMLGQSLRAQGILDLDPAPRDDRWYLKAPAFSFAKLSGMDVCLSPEMKSTGEAIGYDRDRMRALLKVFEASGIPVKDHGCILVTLADADKETALPLLERFSALGFTLWATKGTADALIKAGAAIHGGIRKIYDKKDPASMEALFQALRQGEISYVFSTKDSGSNHTGTCGYRIRICAAEHGIPVFTAPDTVSAFLDAAEAASYQVAPI